MNIGALFTFPCWRERRRNWRSLMRRLSGLPATVHYFHQADDPRSHLATLKLPALTERYRIRLAAHLVPPPSHASASASVPAAVAAHVPTAPDFSRPPSPEALHACMQALATALRQDEFVRYAPALGDAMWRGLPLPQVKPPAGQEPDCDGTCEEEQERACTVQRWLDTGKALRRKLGHHLGASFYFEGEWYVGPDQMHELEQRLQLERLDWHSICRL